MQTSEIAFLCAGYMVSLIFMVPVVVSASEGRGFSSIESTALAVFWPISLFVILLKTLWKILKA